MPSCSMTRCRWEALSALWYTCPQPVRVFPDCYKSPPIAVLPCLSRLMDRGIGKDRTREDHAGVSNQLYAAYAEGCDLRDLVAIVGEDSLSDRDRKFLQFADEFEKRFVSQGNHEDRSIEQTLTIAWELLSGLPVSELKKIDETYIKKYLPNVKEEK